jgi:hypothetical protein
MNDVRGGTVPKYPYRSIGGIGVHCISTLSTGAPTTGGLSCRLKGLLTTLQATVLQTTSDDLVHGLILKADMEVHEQFKATPDIVKSAVAAQCLWRPR